MTDAQRNKVFQENFEEIDRVVSSKRKKWNLKAIPWMDFEDVKQIIFLHIYKKIHQWNESRGSIGAWVNIISSNQLKNLLRNNYYNFARPCLGCEFNTAEKNGKFAIDTEEKSCSLTPSGTQCAECPIFAKWIKSKKEAYNIKLPVPIETQELEITKKDEHFIDYSSAENKLHKKMEIALTIKDFKCYKLLFIDKLSDEETAVKLGYMTNEKNRKAGYNTIKKLKRHFLLKAKEIMDKEDIIF